MRRNVGGGGGGGGGGKEVEVQFNGMNMGCEGIVLNLSL